MPNDELKDALREAIAAVRGIHVVLDDLDGFPRDDEPPRLTLVKNDEEEGDDAG